MRTHLCGSGRDEDAIMALHKELRNPKQAAMLGIILADSVHASDGAPPMGL